MYASATFFLVLDEVVEIGYRFGELLVEQSRYAAAEIGIRQIGTQVYRFAEIVQGIVVISEPRTCYGAVGIGGREYGIFLYRYRKIGVRTQQVIEIVFGDSAQKITLVGVVVEAQQDVERPYRLLEIVVHHVLAPYPEKIVPVVLRRAFYDARQQ